MSKIQNNFKLDAEEIEILEAYENGVLGNVPVSDSIVLAEKKQ